VKNEKMFRCLLEIWHAVPNDYGYRMSEAKPAGKGECIILLTTKYETNVVKTDRDNDVTKLRFSIDFCEKCHVGDVTVGDRRVVPTFGFLLPVGHQKIARRVAAMFVKTATSGLVSDQKSSGHEIASFSPCSWAPTAGVGIG